MRIVDGSIQSGYSNSASVAAVFAIVPQHVVGGAVEPRDYVALAVLNLSCFPLADFARRIGCDPGAMDAWVAGDSVPDPASALKLAAAAGIPSELAMMDSEVWQRAPRRVRKRFPSYSANFRRCYSANFRRCRAILTQALHASGTFGSKRTMARALQAAILLLALTS